MPDVVVIRVPKEVEKQPTAMPTEVLIPPAPPPPRPTLLAEIVRRLLMLPARTLWAILRRLWRKLFGQRPKP